jgi:hypothetical protein
VEVAQASCLCSGFEMTFVGAVYDIYKTLTIPREMGYVGDIKGLVSYLSSQVSPD